MPFDPALGLVNAAQAARRLGLHPNTMALRIRVALRDGYLEPRGYTSRGAPVFAWVDVEALWGKAPPPRPGVKRAGPSRDALDAFSSVANEILGRRPV